MILDFLLGLSEENYFIKKLIRCNANANKIDIARFALEDLKAATARRLSQERKQKNEEVLQI